MIAFALNPAGVSASSRSSVSDRTAAPPERALLTGAARWRGDRCDVFGFPPSRAAKTGSGALAPWPGREVETARGPESSALAVSKACRAAHTVNHGRYLPSNGEVIISLSGFHLFTL